MAVTGAKLLYTASLRPECPDSAQFARWRRGLFRNRNDGFSQGKVRIVLDAKVIAAVNALVREGSFRAAAETIGASAATFSRHIAQAEKYAGTALFERGKGAARLTPGGRIFIQRLAELEAAQAHFADEVARLRDHGPEILRIGCGPLTIRTIISPRLAELREERPQLALKLVVSAAKAPLEMLRAGALDIAICDLTHTPDLSDLDILVLRRETLSFWARPQHPIFDGPPPSVPELLRRPFGSPHLHRHWREAMKRALGGDDAAKRMVEQAPQVECDDYALLCDLATRCDLMIAARDDIVAEYAATGALRQVTFRGAMKWNICAAKKSGGGFPALDRFWTRLEEMHGPEAEGGA